MKRQDHKARFSEDLLVNEICHRSAKKKEKKQIEQERGKQKSNQI